MEMEEKKNELTEAALPVQELPADIPDEVRQKLVRDLNEEATEDLKQDIREAEKEEARDEEVKADPEMLTKSRLLKMLVKKQYVKLREVTEEEQPADLAELLEELDENNRLVVFRLLKKEVATEAFAYMSDEARDDLVNAFSDVELVSAIEEMSLDDAADLLEDMPAGVVKRVLEKSSKQTRESLNKLLNYPESSAGSLMTPEYVRLKKEMNVRQALDAIRRQGENAETVYINYVVERNRLKGVVSARDLLLADPDTPLVDIMDDNVVTVKVTDDQEFVAREMQRYDFTAMPVVDNEGMFVGIITIDDAIDVLTDESTEDMQKMAAILPADEATTYFGTSVWTHAKQRIPWLLILMLSATFTGMVTTHYEEAFVSLPLLVSFMPMLMDTAGNCGNQISTLMVREVEPADFLKVLAKELRVSAIVGAVLGLVNGLRIYLMYTFIFAGQYDNVMGYAIVVSVSLFFSVILAKLVGGMLPLAAKKLGADPAIMATPFITTIVDACSLILYFQIAQVVFRNMM
jgi:magnesium transporter